MKQQYLKITIHDNDFIHELESAGKVISETLGWQASEFLTSGIDFALLKKEIVKHMCATYCLRNCIKGDKYQESDIADWFDRLTIKIVDEIGWENKEDLYICLFETCLDKVFFS